MPETDRVNMSKVQMLRSVVNQRLTAAAQEIFGLFERTIAEYEEELSASKEENERQRRLLDAVFNPEVRIRRADVHQLLVVQEEVPPEQQDWSSSLDQEDPEPPHIKEEQEELWISQEGEQLQGLEEAGIKFSFTPVKSEEDFGGPESDRKSDPERHPGPDIEETSQASEWEIYDSRDPLETLEPQSDLNPLQNNEVPVSDVNCTTGTTPLSSPECDGSSDNKRHLKRHSGSKTGVKKCKCSVCGRRFVFQRDLKRHILSHTGEKPFSCSVCGKKFARAQSLKEHFIFHTGEKPFSCSVCGKTFTRAQSLTRHAIVHTGEKPFSCSVCGKTFARKGNLELHMYVHTFAGPQRRKKH